MIRLITAVLFALFLFGATPAGAQYEDEKPSKFGLKLMNFYPRDSALKSIKSSWFGFGLDYYLKKNEDGKPLSYVTVGLLNMGDTYPKAGQDPVTYTMLHRRPISASRESYTGYGAGVYRMKIVDKNGWLPGIHALYGQEFQGAYFLEFRYDLLPGWQHAEWGGFSINLGTRVSL